MIRKDIIDERILRDLRRNLENKIVQDIADYVDRCQTAELDYSASASELMTLLIRMTTWYAVRQFDIPANEFAQVLGDEYLRAMRRHAAEK